MHRANNFAAFGMHLAHERLHIMLHVMHAHAVRMNDTETGVYVQLIHALHQYI